ncbi:MAG: hypothetical protein L3J87_01050 [Thermoplasmata archaeon]|nr:hypothetical protein [Thermoplasmata archaeon]
MAYATASAVVIALVVPLLFPGVGFGLVTHETCELGPVEATGVFWTPMILLNSPYLGWAWANLTESGFILGINISDGGSAGVFELAEWNLSGTRNVSTVGPGVNHPCVQPLLPTASPSHDEGGYTLAHPLNRSDANETANFSMADPGFRAEHPPLLPSVRFGNAFDPASVRFNASTCGGGAAASDSSSTEYSFEIPFTSNGHTLLVPAQLPALVSYSYRFPANVGVWQISNPDPGVTELFHGGWAFNFRTCAIF